MLKYAFDKLKADKGVVLEVVKQGRQALVLASEDHKANKKEAVLEAGKYCGSGCF